MEMQGREHIGWIDLLRVVACFLVVLSHCCDPFVARFDADRGAFLTGVFTGSFVRACVPLFVMMTGVLLLPVRAELGDFYRKRIGRIVVPLVFWSVVLPLSYFVYLNYVVSTGNPMIVADDHTLGATLPRIYTFIFNFNYDTTPLWYLYMLVGLYLIMPVIGAWLQQASRRDIRLVLYVWGVTLLLPYIKMVAPALGYTGNYGNMGILGVCDWNSYGTFYYVSGFIGYLILAYYLAKYPPQWSWKRTLAVTVPMFLGGYLITSFGYVLTQQYFPGDYAYLEIVWLFTGINQSSREIIYPVTYSQPKFLVDKQLISCLIGCNNNYCVRLISMQCLIRLHIFLTADDLVYLLLIIHGFISNVITGNEFARFFFLDSFKIHSMRIYLSFFLPPL